MSEFGEPLDVNLRRPFDPGSIAVNGVSAGTGTVGYGTVKNDADFEDSSFPVHPDRECAVFGRESVDSIAGVGKSDEGGSEGADAGDGEGA